MMTTDPLLRCLATPVGLTLRNEVLFPDEACREQQQTAFKCVDFKLAVLLAMGLCSGMLKQDSDSTAATMGAVEIGRQPLPWRLGGAA